METTINNKIENKFGKTKLMLIEMAINNCENNYKKDINKICEEIVKIMEERYNEHCLDYHSKRIGFESTSKIINEIHLYFDNKKSNIIDINN